LIRPVVDLDALRQAEVQHDPFPFLTVPNFIRAEAFDAISSGFPAIAHPGSFPLMTLSYGAGFSALAEDLQKPELAVIVSEKLGVDLNSRPTMITVRGQSSAIIDGKIHADSRTKLVTALIYMNDNWESPNGRLRLLRSRESLADVVAEVPPEKGALLLFRNDPHAWHGYEPFSGPRRVVQLNWVVSKSVVRREEFRHRISAFFKRFGPRGA
jgi:SM-20-related protein